MGRMHGGTCGVLAMWPLALECEPRTAPPGGEAKARGLTDPRGGRLPAAAPRRLAREVMRPRGPSWATHAPAYFGRPSAGGGCLHGMLWCRGARDNFVCENIISCNSL